MSTTESTSSPLSERRFAAYRSDIDGLRAVAVVPVVAYHVGIHAVRGGFVGVDVFFVISGYLISQMLIADIKNDRFSILTFYERRIRRILPALLAVLAAATGLLFLAGLPSEFVEYSKSLIAAAASVSNFYFWLHAGYFDGAALTRPLLHTWSLAVEEQFYVLWPVCLYLAFRFQRRHVVALTAGVALISLLISVVGAFTHPIATFYLLHTRAWELLLGALLALGAVGLPLGRIARNVIAVIGFLLIVLTVFLISPDLPFPGLLAVPPCLGAAMIILAGRDGPNIVGRVLSWGPFVFIGLISYSLYLWHWPIVVMHKGGYLTLVHGQSERVQKLVMIAVSLVVASISWKFIEQPFRAGPWRPARGALMRFAGIGTAVIVMAGIVGWWAGGFPQRYSAQELRMASYLTYNGAWMYRLERCFLAEPNGAQQLAPECLALSATAPNYLILGDSHAADLWYGLKSTFPRINFLQATASGCYPTVVHALSESPLCTRVLDGVLQQYVATHRVDAVVLTARWSTVTLPRLQATLEWLERSGVPVTVLGPVAVFDGPLPRLMVNASRRGELAAVGQDWDRSLLRVDAPIAEMASKSAARYVSMIDLMCSANSCLTADSAGMPIDTDSEHFSPQGSIIAAERLKSLGLWQSPPLRSLALPAQATAPQP